MSHGLSHQNLLELEDVDVKKELVESKQIIEKKLGSTVKSFSCPYGRFSSRWNKVFESTGYEVVTSVGHGLNDFSSLVGIPIRLKTVPVKIDDSLNVLESKLYSRHYLRS